MTRKNIFSYTEATAPNFPYPGYISINQEADDRHTVAVRNRGQANSVSIVELTTDELETMARHILAKLGKSPEPAAVPRFVKTKK